MRVESMRLSLASRVSVGSQRLCDRVLHWARVPVRPGARDRPGSATAIARAAAFTRSEAEARRRHPHCVRGRSNWPIGTLPSGTRPPRLGEPRGSSRGSLVTPRSARTASGVGPRRASGAATSSVHEARLKQRPPAAVSCVERRAHVHGWSSDSAVVHEERERCLDSSCADEVHALGSCSHRRHTGRSGLV